MILEDTVGDQSMGSETEDIQEQTSTTKIYKTVTYDT